MKCSNRSNSCIPSKLKRPSLMHHKLYHLKQYKYSQDPISWVVLNIGRKQKSYFEENTAQAEILTM